MNGEAYAHLHPEVRAIADLPDEQRIECIRAERWITHSMAATALTLLQEVLDQPPRERMENVLLVAESGMGKTSLIRKFERANAAPGRDGDGARRMPVVVVLMPPEPTEHDFFGQVLAALGAPPTTARPVGRTVTSRRDVACRLLREVGARVLVVDEINSVLAGTPRQQRLFLQLLRFLSNELRVGLVCTGIPEARHALLSDPQLRSRFGEHEMPPWVAGPELQRFINRLVQGLPLRQPSAIDSPRLCRLLAERAGGITLHIRRALERAAIAAVCSGEERITAAALEATAVWGSAPITATGQRPRLPHAPGPS